MAHIKLLPHFELCPDGAEFETLKDESICEAALRSGIKIEHACEMSCACTTCHIIVRDGFDNLNEATEDEEDLLDKAWGLEPNSRLSCQTVPENGNFTVDYQNILLIKYQRIIDESTWSDILEIA